MSDKSPLVTVIEDRLKNYISAMAPGKTISNVEIIKQQRVLWTGVFKQVLSISPQHFAEAWAAILALVAQNTNGCFGMAYRNRLVDEAISDRSERRQFDRLLHLACVTADIPTRSLALKQVDLGLILASLPDERQRQMFLEFYNKL